MDSLDAQQQKVMQNVWDALNFFQKINKYCYTEDNKDIHGFKDFIYCCNAVLKTG